jgi:hypothetical protein
MFALNTKTFLDDYYLCVSSDVNKGLADHVAMGWVGANV